MKRCKTCYGIPTRRPLDRPCECGERWSAERIRFAADGNHGTASAHGESSFCEPEQPKETRAA